jgi:hypothetical protein
MLFMDYSDPGAAAFATLTAKGKFSCKALAHLAVLDPAKTTQATDIARSQEHPEEIPRRHPRRASQRRHRPQLQGAARRLPARARAG